MLSSSRWRTALDSTEPPNAATASAPNTGRRLRRLPVRSRRSPSVPQLQRLGGRRTGHHHHHQPASWSRPATATPRSVRQLQRRQRFQWRSRIWCASHASARLQLRNICGAPTELWQQLRAEDLFGDDTLVQRPDSGRRCVDQGEPVRDSSSDVTPVASRVSLGACPGLLRVRPANTPVPPTMPPGQPRLPLSLEQVRCWWHERICRELWGGCVDCRRGRGHWLAGRGGARVSDGLVRLVDRDRASRRRLVVEVVRSRPSTMTRPAAAGRAPASRWHQCRTRRPGRSPAARRVSHRAR